MDIYVLNKTYEKIGIVDSCESVIWTRRYCNAGDFELYLPITSEALQILKIDNMLVRADKPNSLMIIKSIKITTDEESGNYLTVTGESAESILKKRIVWKQTNLNGTVVAGVEKLLTENLINPTDAARKIENVEMGECCECATTLTKQITGDNLLKAVMEILNTFKLGFKFDFIDDKLKFCIYSGVDRSSGQSDRPRVVFSADFDNLLSSEYEADVSDYKNVALVAGEGEGAARRRYAVGDASGIERNELYVDARDISSETDGGTLQDAEYNALLLAKGEEALNETLTKQSFTGTIEPGVNYEFGVDYELGDVVQIENEYGITAPARITEVIEAWDESGYSCVPTFYSEEV